MKAKKVLLILLALILVALSALSCRKKEAQEGFFTSISSRPALTSSAQVSLQGYTFDGFLSRGLIRVREVRDDGTYYGVLSGTGEIVVPVSYTLLEMTESTGDFIVAEGGEESSKYHVFSMEGRLLYTSDHTIEVTDVGSGYFSVAEESNSYLFDGDGANALPGTLLDSTFSYSVCGDFILARSASKGRTFVFHARRSDTLLSFFDSETMNYLVSYSGGNDFIVVKTEKTDGAAYDVVIDRGEGPTYYKQTVRRYTIGLADPVTLSPGRFIVKIYNAYSIGQTAATRETYALKEGYQGVAYYVTEGRKASGALNHYIADGSLREIKSMPYGVSALITPVDGIAAATNSQGVIFFFDENADVVGRIDDAVYQNVVFSGEIVTASKVTENGVIRLGGFDRSGRMVIPFEYSYISAFVGGKAVASKGGKAYLVTTDGREEYVGNYLMPHYFDGFYEVYRDGRIGATSFDGVVLIPPTYQNFTAVSRYQNVVYVAVTLGTVTDVYRLY